MYLSILLLFFACLVGLVTVLVTTSTGRPGYPGRSGLFEVKAKYRLEDGSSDYSFHFCEQSDGSFRVYILYPPGPTPHRLHDSESGAYICWSEPIPDLNAAKTVARAWSELTHRFLSTGQNF